MPLGPLFTPWWYPNTSADIRGPSPVPSCPLARANLKTNPRSCPVTQTRKLRAVVQLRGPSTAPLGLNVHLKQQ